MGRRRSAERFRPGRFFLAVALSAVATAAVVLAYNQGRLRRKLREANRFDLHPVPVSVEVSSVVDLPTGGGNAADQYELALELLEEERPRYEALVEELNRTGVTRQMRLDFRCLEALLAGTTRAYCRFSNRLPRTAGELDDERDRLSRLMELGRILAAVSRQAELQGRTDEAARVAGRLVILGWHLTQSTGGVEPARTRPSGIPAGGASPAAGLDARIAGFTLIRWGARALGRLFEATGAARKARKARALEQDAARASDSLAKLRLAMLRNLFLQARVARESTDAGGRLLAVILIGKELAHRRRPLLVGRAQYDALLHLLERLRNDPNPDIAAAARQALDNSR